MPGFDPLPGLPPATPDFTPAAESSPQQSPANLDQLSNQFSSLMGQPQRTNSTSPRVERQPNRDRDESRTEDHKDDSAQETPGQEGAKRSDSRPQIHRRSGNPGQGDGDGQPGDDLPQSDVDPLKRETATEPSPQIEAGLPQFSFGDAILKSFGSPAGEAAGKTGMVTAAESLNKLAGEVASRILVSDPAYSGNMEVRIQLKDSILPGTEVQITQVGDQVQIKIVTESNRSYDVLSTNSELLKSQLEQLLDGRNVSVEVSMQSGADTNPDGRSRQQRDLAEEMQEKERNP